MHGLETIDRRDAQAVRDHLANQNAATLALAPTIGRELALNVVTLLASKGFRIVPKNGK